MKAKVPSALFPVSATQNTTSNWTNFFLALAAAFGLWWLVSDGNHSARSEDVLRAQFRLPADVEFVASRYPMRGSANHIEGIAQFTERQYAEYLSMLDDPAIWTAQPYSFGWDAVSPPFSPRALKWEALPFNYFAGTRNVMFGHLSKDVATNAKEGRSFCLALRLPPGERKASWTRPVRKEHEHLWPLDTPVLLDRYNGLACNEMGRTERPKYTLHGVLLEKKRTLHMIIQ